MSNENKVLEPLETSEGKAYDSQMDITDFFGRLNERIFQTKSQLKKNINVRRNYFLLSLAFALPITAKYLYLIHLNIIIEIIFWILSILLFFAALGTEKSKYKEELEKLEYKRNYLLQFYNSDYKPTYFDSLVNINIENLSEYYTLVKVHTKKAFSYHVRHVDRVFYLFYLVY